MTERSTAMIQARTEKERGTINLNLKKLKNDKYFVKIVDAGRVARVAKKTNT